MPLEPVATSFLCTPRQKIIKEKAVPMIEGYMFEEHEMIRLAATECMCNLALSPEVRGTGQTGRLGPRLGEMGFLIQAILWCRWPSFF